MVGKKSLILFIVIVFSVGIVAGAYECEYNSDCDDDYECVYDYICIDDRFDKSYDCYEDDDWDVGESSSICEKCETSYSGKDGNEVFGCYSNCKGNSKTVSKSMCAKNYFCDYSGDDCYKSYEGHNKQKEDTKKDEGPGEDLDGDDIPGEDDVFIEPTCIDDTECAKGYECYNNDCKRVCTDESEGYLDYFGYGCSYEYDYCKDNSQCAEDYYCSSLNHCVQDGTLTVSAIDLCASKDCSGFDCESGTCLTSCTNGGDCDADPRYYCNTLTSQCVASCSPYGVNNYGSCYNSCVDKTYCATNYACGSDSVCSKDSDGNGVADIEETTSSATIGCSVDSDCADEEACQESTGDCIAYCTITECNDEIDNDGDGYIDWDGNGDVNAADSECRSPYDNNESSDPQCADGLDNYHDGKTDYPYDPSCESPEDDSEMAVMPAAAPETEGLFSKIWDFLIFWD